MTSVLLASILGLFTVGAFVWLLQRSLLVRQQAAAVLYEQREQYRLTLASIGDGVITTDAEGKVTFLNAIAQSLTGWTQDEARGMALETVFNVVNEETRETIEDPALRALKEGRIMGPANHTSLISKSGNDCPIDDSAAPIRNADGIVTGAVLVFRDVTQRRQLERVNAEQLAVVGRLASIVDSSEDAIIGKSLDGIIRSWNAASERLFGYTAEQAVGRNISFLIPADRSDEEPRIIARLRAGERVESFNTVRLRNDGQPVHVSLTISPVKDADGRVVGASKIVRDISAQKEAEGQLRQSEQFNRSLMEGTADCVKVLDMEGRLLHMNTPGLCAMEIDDFGPLCGLAWGELWPAEAGSDIEQSVARAAAGEASSFQAYCPTTKGTPKWWEVTVSPVRDADDGRVLRLLVVSRDITERAQVERALHDSEQRMRLAAETTGVGVWEWNVFTDEIRWDATMFQIYGMTPTSNEFVQYSDWKESLVPEDLRQQEQVLRDTVHRVGKSNRTFRIRRRNDGECRQIQSVETVRMNEKGEAQWVVGTNLDVTERKRAEEELRESDERYRAATVAVSGLIWTNSAEGSMEGEQREWGEFTGQSREQYQGYGWSKAVHPEDAQPTIEAWSRAVAGKRTFDFEHRLRRRDGEWRICSIRAVPILTADGTIREWVGVHTDITERKRDEEKLRRLASELSEAHRRKDEFLATLAHELRNPLAPIRTGLQLMKLAGPETAEKARSMMERQVTQMVRLVDDLMDVSRISQGKLELRKERVELADVLNSALETSRPLIEQMGHELTVTLPKQALVVDADMTRLSQVFLNLLNNAAKYGDRNGHIQLDVERQGRDVVVTVKDNGIGIAADQLLRIFEMFTQVDGSMEQSQGGLGIGLMLVKRLVEMHGGRVEARSDGPGKGSEFVVRLPILIEASAPQESGHVVEQPAKSSHRILVVDDNRDSADSLSEMLKITGNDIRTAYDGQAAVEVAGVFRPDVILLDIGLPKLNGYEACRSIREQPWGKGIVLIAVTGWGQDDDRRRSREAGFDHHMVKPLDPQALMKMLAGLHAKQ